MGKPEGRDQLKDPSIAGRIVLKHILRKWAARAWTEFICLTTGVSGKL